MTFHPDSIPDLTGCVYIVTGGTSGMYALRSSDMNVRLANRHYPVDITQ
jgi:hypothetical protein